MVQHDTAFQRNFFVTHCAKKLLNSVTLCLGVTDLGSAAPVLFATRFSRGVLLGPIFAFPSWGRLSRIAQLIENACPKIDTHLRRYHAKRKLAVLYKPTGSHHRLTVRLTHTEMTNTQYLSSLVLYLQLLEVDGSIHKYVHVCGLHIYSKVWVPIASKVKCSYPLENPA